MGIAALMDGPVAGPASNGLGRKIVVLAGIGIFIAGVWSWKLALANPSLIAERVKDVSIP